MITDEALRAALEEVDNAILASLPEPSACEHRFSARFEKRMRKVRRRAKHPMAYKVLRQAACFLLAILILFSSVMVFSTEVRAAVVDWIKEQFEIFSHYFFAGDPEPNAEERAEYELGWLPDGFSLVNSHNSGNKRTQVYLCESRGIIQFSYFYGTDTGALYLDHQGYEHRTTWVGNCCADVFISSIPGEINDIIWLDDELGVLFYISADANESELIQLAESIKKIN